MTEMTTGFFIGVTVTIFVKIVLGVLFYVNWKVNKTLKLVKNFPSPKQIMKEIMSMKMPVSDLPPEAMENLQEVIGDEIGRRKKEIKEKLPPGYVG